MNLQSPEDELYVKLRHPDRYTDPGGFVDSLPDWVINHFFIEGDATPIEERRWQVRDYFVRANEFASAAINVAFDFLITYYKNDHE